MIRVLHLIDDGAEYQSRRAVADLSARLGDEFSSAVAPSRSVATLATRIRRIEHDVIHAWSLGGLLAAAFVAKKPIVFSPPTDLSRSAHQWVRPAVLRRDVQVACSSAVQQRRMVEAGLPAPRLHVISPGVEGDQPAARDDALRQALGFKENDFILLAAGESTRAARHEHAVWAGSILHVIDERNKLLLWGEGPTAVRAATQGRRMNQPKLCRVAKEILNRRIEFDDLLPACDAVLAPADGDVAPLLLMQAMAAGRPIVGTSTPSLMELLENGRTAWLVPPTQPRQLAQHVLDLREDAARRQSIIEAARRAAIDRFPNSRFIDLFRELYRRVMKE